MTIEVQEDVVDNPDGVGAIAAAGNIILDILPHRGVGKNVVDTVLSLPFTGVKAQIITNQLDDFYAGDLADMLQAMNDTHCDIFKVIPHRHGNVVRITVYGVQPMRQSRYFWHVERCTDYERGLTRRLTELHANGFLLFDIMPHRIGADNFPVLIMRQPVD